MANPALQLSTPHSMPWGKLRSQRDRTLSRQFASRPGSACRSMDTNSMRANSRSAEKVDFDGAVGLLVLARSTSRSSRLSSCTSSARVTAGNVLFRSNSCRPLENKVRRPSGSSSRAVTRLPAASTNSPCSMPRSAVREGSMVTSIGAGLDQGMPAVFPNPAGKMTTAVSRPRRTRSSDAWRAFSRIASRFQIRMLPVSIRVVMKRVDNGDWSSSMTAISRTASSVWADPVIAPKMIPIMAGKARMKNKPSGSRSSN